MHHLLTIPQAAERIQMSRATVKHWAYRRRPAPPGFPDPVRINRNLRYIAQDIDEWIDSLRDKVERRPVFSPERDANLNRRRCGRPRKVSTDRRMGARQGIA